MKLVINARNQSFPINLPDSLIQRAVEYALGVVAQRETAGMEDDTETERVAAIRERFARIESGDWKAGGGRAADPITRELVKLLRSAAVYKKANPAYKPDVVPGASDPAKVGAFVKGHFTPEQTAKLAAKAKKVADAAKGDVL
jgi:hypothetical protein